MTTTDGSIPGISTEQLLKLNDLITKSTSQISCDDDCKRQQEKVLVEQALADAKNNYKTAPEKLAEANARYLAFVNGVSYTQTMQDMSNTEKEHKLLQFKTMTDQKLKDLYAVIKQNTELKNNLNYIDDLNKNLATQHKNEEMDSDFIQTKIITTERNAFYEQQKTERLSYWYNVTLWIYLFFLIFFIIRVLLTVSGIVKKLLFIIPVIIISLIAYYYKGRNMVQIAYVKPSIINTESSYS
jgi:hypothetical protein